MTLNLWDRVIVIEGSQARASEQRAVMNRDAKNSGRDEDTRPIETGAWGVIGLWAFYVLLSALVVALSAAIGTLPYWI